MESQVVKRRMSMIMGHLAGSEDLSATHVFPVNCSSTINSVIRRCDNKVFFARQGSSNQAPFMREGSLDHPGMPLKYAGLVNESSSDASEAPRRCDNKVFFARQGSCNQACFMRQGSLDHPGVPPKYAGFVNESSSDASEAPLFSRQSMRKPMFQNFVEDKQMNHECSFSASEPPTFARPNRGFNGQKQVLPMKVEHIPKSHDVQWSPRMDVAELGHNYVITIELPGVGINDIRVEVDNKNLTVMGKRSTQWWRVEKISKDSISAYHKREISEGPCHVVWPLPPDVNRDRVSAEFVDGFLQITIPKL